MKTKYCPPKEDSTNAAVASVLSVPDVFLDLMSFSKDLTKKNNLKSALFLFIAKLGRFYT